MIPRLVLAEAVVLATLGGCAALPSNSPTARQVVKPAQNEMGPHYRLVDINSLSPALTRKTNAEDYQWPFSDGPEWSGMIAVGDTIGITIFEIGYSLFSHEGIAASLALSKSASAPSASGVTLPNMMVSDRGTVLVPYIGTVTVAGRSSDMVAGEIQRRLRGKSQSAQVVVSVGRGTAQSVVLSGDIKQPGRQVLTPSGETVMDAVAQAGGPTGRNADTQIRLTRGNTSAELPMAALQFGSPYNVRLAAGDHVELIRKMRSFTVLGAAKSVTEVPFEADRLMLSEALSRAGGPVDDKADARGVFIFRFEQEKQGDQIVEKPIIYRLDLLKPQSYFSAQRFEMKEKDVILVANARSNSVQKFIQLLNQLVSPAVTIDLLTR